MNEQLIREKIHRAVDVHGASMQDDPYLAQRIIAQTNRKEAPRMKKLSTGMIIAIVLMLLSVTAVAVGLTIEDVWQQSFEKMNTSGSINNISDASEAEISMEEAISIARSAIVAKYGTPEAELDAMGVYPTYAARGWDGKTDDYPSEWDILFSSRTDVDIDSHNSELDQHGQIISDYGPTGEYLVYINAESKEVTYCSWYTNDFWSRAQTVWDCGSYDEVYWWYQKPEFYDQPIEQQLHFEQLLSSQGYELIHHSKKYKALLKSCYLDLLYFDPALALDAGSDAQAAAAWAAVEKQYGYDAGLLQKHGFIATRSTYQTGTDDIFIVFNYGVDSYEQQLGFTNRWCDHMASDVRRAGSFLVSFETGTTHPVGVTHLWYTETNPFVTRITKGLLYEQTDWDNDDLIAFDEAFTLLVRAVQRMKTAGFSVLEMEPVVRDYINRLGGNPESYPAAPDVMDADQWFAEESEWDAKITMPEMSYEELEKQYGFDNRFWPLELQAQFDDSLGLSVPREGELTQDEAIARAVNLLINTYGQEALDALGDYAVGCQLFRFVDEGDCTRWHIYITDDPEFCLNGYRVAITQRNGEDWGEDEINPIEATSNG